MHDSLWQLLFLLVKRSGHAMSNVKGPLLSSGPQRGCCNSFLFKMILYIAIFTGIIVAVKYAGSLDVGTVSSYSDKGQPDGSDVSPTSYNHPPPASYEKILMSDLKFKTSSFEVCG